MDQPYMGLSKMVYPQIQWRNPNTLMVAAQCPPLFVVNILHSYLLRKEVESSNTPPWVVNIPFERSKPIKTSCSKGDVIPIHTLSFFVDTQNHMKSYEVIWKQQFSHLFSQVISLGCILLYVWANDSHESIKPLFLWLDIPFIQAHYIGSGMANNI